MYSAHVMDHFQNPRNAGDLPGANAVGSAGNPSCGDVLRLYLKIENGRVAQASFKTFGCGAAIATSSILTEMVKGKTVEELRAVTNAQVVEALGGLPPFKAHCSVLAEDALRSALADYSSGNGAG
ncbi:MAG: iron-sulfur cluster assembly scaffold protein [Elusimicrobia bacterium]|nr:iron-sulfur cluster assembly scaffold protein [Elusimicrobiota bacterium]